MKEDLGHGVTKITGWENMPVDADMYVVETKNSLRPKFVNYTPKVAPGDGGPLLMMEHQGWGEAWEVWQDWNGRYVVCSIFDGPIALGAGCRQVMAIISYDTSSSGSIAAAYMAAANMVTQHMLAELMDNAT